MPYKDELRSLFIVSKVALLMDQDLDGSYQSDDIEGLKIAVSPSSGEKCERCWVHEPSVGTFSDHPTICERCHTALERI
jgi:isoleucyl-tRNA synthetase